MKGLLKHISPLAPDDSGACSVLYELGGIVVICDAGGCAGNVCGFDEPRWHEKRSALFSAGLRDMDAILGRDDRLIEKLVKVYEQLPDNYRRFTAIVGTPVPAVIATDFHALERMAERKTHVPCLALPTDGTRAYDFGEEMAYFELFKRFTEDGINFVNADVVPGRIGIIGATPLDTGCTRAAQITAWLDSGTSRSSCKEYVCFGMDSDVEDIRAASSCESMLVISPAGIKAAEFMKKKFGTPYKVGFPCLPRETVSAAEGLSGKKVLIINQQFAANALREKISNCEADCATWFMLDKTYARDGDFRITEEDVLTERIAERGYDVIIADIDLKRAVSRFAGEFIDFPHYAVSARLFER